MEEREQPLANATKHRMAAIAGVIAFVKSDDELDEEELDEALDEALDEDEEPDQEEDKCKDKESGPDAAKRQSRRIVAGRGQCGKKVTVAFAPQCCSLTVEMRCQCGNVNLRRLTGRRFNSLGLVGLGADTLGLGLFGGLCDLGHSSRQFSGGYGLIKLLFTLFCQCQFEGIGLALNRACEPARFDH